MNPGVYLRCILGIVSVYGVYLVYSAPKILSPAEGWWSTANLCLLRCPVFSRARVYPGLIWGVSSVYLGYILGFFLRCIPSIWIYPVYPGP